MKDVGDSSGPLVLGTSLGRPAYLEVTSGHSSFGDWQAGAPRSTKQCQSSLHPPSSLTLNITGVPLCHCLAPISLVSNLPDRFELIIIDRLLRAECR